MGTVVAVVHDMDNDCWVVNGSRQNIPLIIDGDLFLAVVGGTQCGVVEGGEQYLCVHVPKCVSAREWCVCACVCGGNNVYACRGGDTRVLWWGGNQTSIYPGGKHVG